MYCIRDKKTDLLMGVSYTEEGLKYVTNKMGRCILFRNAFLKYNSETSKITLVGDLRMNKRLKVEPYKFKTHSSKFINSVESWYKKVVREKSY